MYMLDKYQLQLSHSKCKVSIMTANMRASKDIHSISITADTSLVPVMSSGTVAERERE